MSEGAGIIFDDTAQLTVQGTLNIVQEVIPPPCHYCLQNFNEGDEVLNIVSHVSKAEGIVLGFIHRGCKPQGRRHE